MIQQTRRPPAPRVLPRDELRLEHRGEEVDRVEALEAEEAAFTANHRWPSSKCLCRREERVDGLGFEFILEVRRLHWIGVPAEGVDGESVGDDRVEARSDERQDGFQECPIVSQHILRRPRSE